MPSKRIQENLKPIVIENVKDIRNAIKPFTKSMKINKVDISADVTWVDEDKKTHTEHVSAYSTDVNVRQGLIDGFEQVKEQVRMWNDLHDVLGQDEYGSSLPEVNIDKFHMPVDRIIKHRLGGTRVGMTIVWQLADRKVVFDPYSKELTET